jgi:integrase
MDRGTYESREAADSTTLGDLIGRYLNEVVSGTRSARDDAIRLRALQRQRISQLWMSSVTPAQVAAFRDERLCAVKPATVVRELAYLSAIINHARREWGIHCANAVQLVKKPAQPLGRDRTLEPDERRRLLDELAPAGRRNPWMRPLVLLALETAMRRGELLALRWNKVDLARRVAHLDLTKNGDRRAVPLSSVAADLLEELPRSICGRVFPIGAAAVDKSFGRALARAGIEDFRFHDLRHTAITSMATKLPNVIELSAVTGHRSLRMLQRYYHPDPAALALKIG